MLDEDCCSATSSGRVGAFFKQVDPPARDGPYPKGVRHGWYGWRMTKTELHALVDALPDESLPAVAILLRRAQDPVVAQLDAAPYDDEELTDEGVQAVRDARTEPGVPWSDVRSELSAG